MKTVFRMSFELLFQLNLRGISTARDKLAEVEEFCCVLKTPKGGRIPGLSGADKHQTECLCP